MKILSIPQVRQADAYTIQNEPIESVQLMERAGQACSDWILQRLIPGQLVMVFAGMGNNGGDGLVIARLLSQQDYAVTVLILNDGGTESPDFKHNLKRLEDLPLVTLQHIRHDSDIPDIPEQAVIIDAIYGSGLSRPAGGLSIAVIDAINGSQSLVIAIDIPSGLFADISSRALQGSVIRADYTLSLQFPKLAMMMSENDEFVGEWQVIPIGLHPDFIRSVDVGHYLLQTEDIKPLLRKRPKFSHKGYYGHALLIAGSKHKMGAAILAARAVLRSGVGLLTVHVPESGISAMHAAVPEAMLSSYPADKFWEDIPDLESFSAIAVGPGIGCTDSQATSLKHLIQNSPIPLILDADALNILALNPTWIPFIKAGSILTPHPGEYQRMLGKSANDFERLRTWLAFIQKHQFIGILKGAHSAIACADGYCFFNSTGNPGMAGGGSGDVLTGMLLGLKAQAYDSEQSAILGCFLHGLAGDIAAKHYGQEAMIASDIIESIPQAFSEL
jgi:ADP-dependent NAD(P)H-hydrate dehydratase / NAD(P)H-hydrate epimerase